MRTIKFRGKQIHGNKWLCGYYFAYDSMSDDQTYHSIVPQQYSSKPSEYFKCVPESISQFTGLFDKKGQEIYEGDIVSNGYRNYSVSFSFRYGWMLTRGDFSYSISNETMDSSIDNGIIDGVVVIGNVFDNPELLDCPSLIQHMSCDKPLQPRKPKDYCTDGG